MGQALSFWGEACAQPWDIYEMKKCNFIVIKTCVCGNRFRYVLVRAIGQQPINVNVNLTFRLYVKIYGRFFKTNLVLQFSSYSDPSKEATGIPGNVSTKVLWSWTFRVKLSPQSPFGSQWPFRNRNSAGCRKRLINMHQLSKTRLFLQVTFSILFKLLEIGLHTYINNNNISNCSN